MNTIETNESEGFMMNLQLQNERSLRNSLITLVVFLLLVALVLNPLPTATAKSSKPIQLLVDGKVTNTSVAPQLINNVVYVPIRQVAQTWDAKVSWNGKSKQITIRKDGNTFVLSIDKRNGLRNSRPITLNASPKVIKNSTMVPVRFFAESFGAQVSWNATQAKISIFNHANQLPLIGSAKNFKNLLAKQFNANQQNVSKRNSGLAFSGIEQNESSNAGTANGGANQPVADSGSNKTNFDSNANGNDFSQTNTQVSGVDEADVIKTDGSHIYQVRNGTITITKVYPSNKMQVVKTLKFGGTDTFSPTEMYVDKTTLTVIGTAYEKNQRENKRMVGISNDAYYGDQPKLKAYVLDITDLQNIQQTREFALDGYYVSSRKIGSQLYLIANKWFYYNPGANSDIPAPSFFDSAVSNSWQSVNFSEIRYFPENMTQQYLMIAGIDVSKPDQSANLTTFLGSGEQVYASTSNLYITMTSYEYKEQPVDPEVGDTKPAVELEANTTDTDAPPTSPSPAIAVDPAISSPMIRGWWWMPTEVNTTIYKFSLEQGVANFVAKGSAPGTILNQFSMDEHEGHFRIATTKTNFNAFGNRWQNEMSNHLYILDPQMKLVGKVENIAPGESIYSVRYVGDRAYMVTFKTVDPLFVIDVSNPAKPTILGELKIPGYSNYLHPYDENHIIGIGKDTVEQSFEDPFSGTSNSFAYYTGMKIALFDVTDVNNPVEKFVEKIGDRGTDSELLYNHKALLFSKEKNIFALPIRLMEVDSINSNDPWQNMQYGQFKYQGAYVYSLDLVNGFKLEKRITHYSEKELATANQSWDFYSSPSNIQRILYIKDQLYTVSNKKIQAHNLGDYKFTGEVVLP
jgi:inhibitor of cysteine peptidase